jgi:hypothetical protein
MQVYKNAVFYRFWSRFPFFPPGYVFRLFVVLCGYPLKNQCGFELKIILSIENDEEPVSGCLFWFLRFQNREKVTQKVV